MSTSIRRRQRGDQVRGIVRIVECAIDQVHAGQAERLLLFDRNSVQHFHVENDLDAPPSPCCSAVPCARAAMAAPTDGHYSGGFTLEATAAARRANMSHLSV